MHAFNPALQLHTERLILRHMCEADLDALAAMQADAQTMQYMARGVTVDRAGSWGSIAWALGHWVMKGHGMFSVEEKATGQMIGRIGTLEPDAWPGFELGWMLRRESWGLGYATEGVRCVLDFVRDDLQRKEVMSLIRPGNLRSENVARKLGMQADGEVELFGSPAQVFRLRLAE